MSLSKMASLNTMPTEVLSCVLNNRAIPLRRRLTLRLLSNRWAGIIEDGLAKETYLVIRDGGNEQFEHNEPSLYDLKVSLVIKSVNLTEQLFQLLARLYPSPTKLAIYFGNEVSWLKLPSLLTHLATNCSSIKLLGHHDFPSFTGFPARAIADSLSAIPALTSLFLMGFRITYNLLPLLGPVVTRLVKFSCLFGWQYTPSLSFRCTHLMIPFYEIAHPVFLRQVSNHLTHIHLVFCNDDNWEALYKIPNLTSLGLVFEDFTLVPDSGSYFEFDSNSDSEFYSDSDFDSDSDSSPFRHLAPLAQRIPSLAVIKLFNLNYWSLLALLSKPAQPMPNIKWLTLLLIFDHEFIVDKKVDTPHEFANFFRFINTLFPTLIRFTIICASDFHDELQATLKEIEIPFSVVILDSQLCKPYNSPW